MRLPGRGPVNSPSRITPENNGKIRPQPDREIAFAGASGGERGIRTLETVSRLHTFQACAFDHSATSPSRAAYTCGHGGFKEKLRRSGAGKAVSRRALARRARFGLAGEAPMPCPTARFRGAATRRPRRLRRMVLHSRLCAGPRGVDAFQIGAGAPGLTDCT